MCRVCMQINLLITFNAFRSRRLTNCLSVSSSGCNRQVSLFVKCLNIGELFLVKIWSNTEGQLAV